jgi:hypothetical protein
MMTWIDGVGEDGGLWRYGEYLGLEWEKGFRNKISDRK